MAHDHPVDRPGTVLDADALGRALDLLGERSISVVTFAADASLAERHDARLDLASDGRWSWVPAAERSRIA